MTRAARLTDRPLVRPLLATGKRSVPWIVALRNTAAIVLPLVAGELTGQLAAGVGVAVGALTTMFADEPGPYRLRLRRLLLAGFVNGCAAFTGAILAPAPAALLAATAVWGFGAALLVAIDPHITRVGLSSLILLVIMGAPPHGDGGALAAGVLVFAGGGLQALFAVTAWPLQRYRPERLALAQAFRGLAGSAHRDVAPGAAVALPGSLNDLQVSLFGTGHARGRAVEAFRVLAEMAERIRLGLFALAHQQADSSDPALRSVLATARAAAGDVLAAIAAALERAAPPRSQEALAAYGRAAAAIDGLPRSAAGELARARLAALGGQLRAATRNVDTAGSRGEIRARNVELRLPAALQPANPLAILRANLRLDAPAFRHAVRSSACVTLALALARVLPLAHAYWMPMTVAIVLKPDFGATWRYALLRVAGTLGGLFLTSVVLHFDAGEANVWIALALMAILCIGFRELASVHYGLAVVCLTGLVVILLALDGVPAETAVAARTVATILGSALALLAYFAWPTWERGRERAALAALLDAYARYLAAVLHGGARARHATRLDARAARSVAQASLDRLAQEPRNRISLPRAEALVAQANRVVRAAMTLEASLGANGAPSGSAVDEFARACDDALREAAGALREARAPRGDFRLRSREQQLVAALPTPGDAFDAGLRDASDRIVDAIDSVLHVLAQPRSAPAAEQPAACGTA